MFHSTASYRQSHHVGIAETTLVGSSLIFVHSSKIHAENLRRMGFNLSAPESLNYQNFSALQMLDTVCFSGYS